jgi:hypothetical protein
MNPPKRIDLGHYAKGVRVLAGRDRGQAVRKAEGLDSIERANVPVVVVIPDHLLSVNSSFFLGMFEKSIGELGEEGFRALYTFEGPGAQQIVDDGVRTALLMGTRLRPARRQTA